MVLLLGVSVLLLLGVPVRLTGDGVAEEEAEGHRTSRSLSFCVTFVRSAVVMNGPAPPQSPPVCRCRCIFMRACVVYVNIKRAAMIDIDIDHGEHEAPLIAQFTNAFKLQMLAPNYFVRMHARTVRARTQMRMNSCNRSSAHLPTC